MVQRNLVNGSRRRFTAALLMLACCGMAAELITMARVAAADAADEPDRYAVSACIVEMAGVKGGLVAHLGCGDGRLTAALRVNERYLVQGLDVDPANVKRARETVRRLGLYGPVSVDQWSGEQLPYADNLVRLMVISVPQAASRDEILRVLCPGGVAVSVEAGGRDIKKTLVKPWPADIDEWTHHLHDSGGNAVARDTVVGPPRHLQWTAGPLWSRSHGWTPSVSAMVSANGRLFYLCDETLTCVDGTVPDRWFLTARDAFSGVLLWKRPVQPWGSLSLSGTPGTGAGSTTGRFTMPPNIGKRLVAVGDTVYTTLGARGPVVALDAATGEERQVYTETAGADEILCADGRLIVTLDPPNPPALISDVKQPPAAAPGKRLCAIDTVSGKLLWNHGPILAIRTTRTQDPFGRLELIAGDGRVFVLSDQFIQAISSDSGEIAWRIDRPSLANNADRRLGFAGVFEFLLTVMVYHDGVVLLAQPEPNSPHTYHTVPGTLYAFDARDGRLLWKHAYGAWGHCTQPDVFVVNGRVWTHMDVPADFSVAANGWIKVPDTASVTYRIQGLDLRSGEVRSELSTRDVFNVGHHHRCYRNKITERFLMASRRGVEFVDLATGENYQNHWVRSGCLLGNLPCNGLLYVAPHSCGCYVEAKLTGFNALAASTARLDPPQQDKADRRLEKGPAYSVDDQGPAPSDRADWPMFRHDPQRSGALDFAVGKELKVAWRSSIGGVPSAPVVAGGRVFVSSVDAHAVHAMDAADGRRLWSNTTGARVESPPSIHNGRAIYGSNDGCVYAVRAADGALAWRFQAAPAVCRVTVHDQLESPWPVPGVLVQNNECWFAAGRSSYLDGGIRVLALDPASGRMVREQTIYSPDPQTDGIPPTSDAQRMPGLLNDVPAGDSRSVFIRQMSVSSEDTAGGQRIYSTAGYLDPTWFNRTYWKYGPTQTSGLMVLGRDAVYGMELYESRSRETVFRPGTSAYRLVCLPLKFSPRKVDTDRGKRSQAKLSEPKPTWERRLPIRVAALVRAGDMLFAAGSPDIVDPSDPHGAWQGRKGGLLAAIAVEDGRQLSEVRLPSPPVWDGLAAAEGKLYLSLQDGHVMCLTGE